LQTVQGPLPHRGFACPYEPLDDGLLDSVADEYARGFARLFLERCPAAVARGGLAEFVQRRLASALGFELVWDNAFGQARRAVLDGAVRGVTRHAAALGLRLMERGASGEWQLELEKPARLAWDRWLLPKGDRIRVSADGARALIEVGRGKRRRRVELSRGASGGWQSGEAEALPLVESDGQRYVVVPGATLDTWRLEGVRPLPRARLGPVPRLVKRAIGLIALNAPVFVPWIGRVLRRIVPVEATPGMMYSGSDEDHPGTIYLSVGCQPVAIAEMLVHEATHQYYYLLARCGALDDGTGRMYFSPVKGTERPVGMILLAYHAFANVLLLYRLCRARKLRDSGYCRQNEKQLVPQLRELEHALTDARSLTPLGEALWQPLAARLR
jgi:HEXXH motif-containing protein